jgi:outer membrane protein
MQIGTPQYRSSITIALALLFGTAAHAEEDHWWLHAGVGRVTFHDHSVLTASGSEVPGAGAKASDNTAAVFELGYQVTPQWSASATFGVPPTSTITGTGTAAPFGKMGEVTYGPLVLAAQYHFGDVGGVRPYLGAGPVYYMVFASKDGAIQQLDAKNGWGSALQAGLNVPLSQRFGLFVDVKKVFVKTTATGFLPADGGAPVKAETTLNPVLIHLGVSARF